MIWKIRKSKTPPRMTEKKIETAKSGLIIEHTSPTPIADEYQEILIECFMEAEDGPSEEFDNTLNRLKQMENEYNIKVYEIIE